MVGEMPSGERWGSGGHDAPARPESSRQGPSSGATLHPVELRIRELAPEELPRLAGVLPEYHGGVDSRTARVVVAEDPAGAIVATWGVFATVHVEPLWIADSHRKNPGLIRGLWEGVWSILEATRQKVSFAVLGAESPALAPAERLGFEKIDGNLYWVRLKAPREHWRSPDGNA